MTDYVLKRDGAIVAISRRGSPRQRAKWLAAGLTVEEGEAVLPAAAETPTTMDDVRAMRNKLLDQYAWTVSAASPLSVLNQLQWKTYLLALHNVTNGLLDPTKVLWPSPPPLLYA